MTTRRNRKAGQDNNGEAARYRYLAEASELLAESLDYERTLARIAELAVPRLADWCAVDVLKRDGSVKRLAVAHVDPSKVELAHDLDRRYPPDPNATIGLPQVLRTGRPEFYPEITDEVLEAVAQDAEHLRLFRELGLKSGLIVPLVARGRTLGAITLIMAESGRRYAEDDLAFAEDLARRAAVAVDNARLVREAGEAAAARDEALADLRASAERLRLAMSAARLGDWSWRIEDDLVTLSPRAAEIFGLAPETEVTWARMRELIHEDEREAVRRAVETAVAGREDYAVEYRVIRPDGSQVWVGATGRAFYDETGRAVGMFGVLQDISRRRQTEAVLRESEKQFRTLAEAMPQLVWATDARGQHLYYNQRWYDYTGLSEELSLGYGFTNALHPDDKQRTLARWRAAWSAGEAYEIEYRFRRHDGEYRWFLGRATPVRDESGEITQWVGTCTDIEEQKQMEALLARLNEEREQMLEEVSTPVVPVLDGVLVMPLIGSLDSVRMERATRAALDEVTRTGAKSLIIDITAARIVDSHAVANLSNLVGALRLVGAEPLVTGISAHVAQNLVGLGIDLTELRTHRTLAQALLALPRARAALENGRRR
jgi:PAS domain S-box-containing protein